MPAISIDSLAAQCAPAVDLITVMAIVRTESGGNPHAVGVVRAELERQPRSHGEALATAKALDRSGYDYSVGLAQINRSNFDRFGLTLEAALDPCTNLRAMQRVLQACWTRSESGAEGSTRIRRTLACYFSGTTDASRFSVYVDTVIANARVARALRPMGQAPP